MTSADVWGTLLTGQTLGDYLLEEHVGSGQFGRVFRARSLESDGVFAAKVLLPGTGTEDSADFDNEGVLLRRLQHCRGVIGYVDGGSGIVEMSIGGSEVRAPVPVKYHVLPLASGTLYELVRDPVMRDRWSWQERLSTWRSVAKGLRQMHRAHVVHRDLKADNCLVMVGGPRAQVKLADLGRARHLDVLPTRPDETYLWGRGDLRHAPPEYLQLQGGATTAAFVHADYYGLGSLLVELTTGQPMTSLAIGDFRPAMVEAAARRQDGSQIDLGVLRSRYDSVIDEVVSLMPDSIHDGAAELLRQLCNPVPDARVLRRSRTAQRRDDDELAWVLRRADILQKRLRIASRHSATSEQRRSA